MSGRALTVVHLLPLDAARGAQAYARAVHDALQAGGDEHRTMTLFASRPAALRADLSLGVPPGPWRRAGFDPRAAIRLRRALRALQPDVVVTYGGEALKYAAPVCPSGVRLIYRKIGLTGVRLRSRAQAGFYRAVVRRADVVAAVSEEMAEEARRLFHLPAERVVVIPNGRNPDTYRPTAPHQPRERPKLVFVGHLTATKRPELFCEVVRALRGRGVSVDGAVVGGGPLLEPLLSVADSAGVDMLGCRNDVPAILAKCAALLFTGTEWEGMPGVLIEAGLCGLPVVTTDVPGARAVVEDGVTGFVVGVNDREALVERAGRLGADPGLRESMGSAARERCLEHFTIEASARRWQTLLDVVLARDGRGRGGGKAPPISRRSARG